MVLTHQFYIQLSLGYIHVAMSFLLKIHSVFVIRNNYFKEKIDNWYRYFQWTCLFLTHPLNPSQLAFFLKKHFKIAHYEQFLPFLSFSLPSPLFSSLSLSFASISLSSPSPSLPFSFLFFFLFLFL